LPEFFNQRFGKPVQIVSAVIVVIGMTFYMVPQLTASGLIGSHVLGIDYKTAVVVLGLGFTLYAALGGMWAITYTDLIQGSVMLIGIVILAVFIMVDHNGVVSLINDAMAVDPAFGDITQPWMSYFGLFIAFLWFGIISPSVVMRNFASRDARTARRSAMWACLLYLTLFIAGFFVTAAGASMGIVDSLNNTDMIFVSVIEQYLPSILGGIMLAGLMSAIMSSADAMLLAISAGIAHDIYKEHINPKASERFVTGLGLCGDDRRKYRRYSDCDRSAGTDCYHGRLGRRISAVGVRISDCSWFMVEARQYVGCVNRHAWRCHSLPDSNNRRVAAHQCGTDYWGTSIISFDDYRQLDDRTTVTRDSVQGGLLSYSFGK